MKSAVKLVMVGAVVLCSTAALAQGTTVEVGSGLTSQIRDVMVAVVAGVASAFFGWVSYWVKEKFGVDIEAKHRDALVAFINRQASSLIAMGAVKLEGVKIDVKSEALASVARLAFGAIPDAMKFFNLTPDLIAKMITDVLPKQPSVAAATAVAMDVKNPETPSLGTSPAGPVEKGVQK